jgi:predicted SnoaL-like aldol condensation-catalyzing enzyme
MGWQNNMDQSRTKPGGKSSSKIRKTSHKQDALTFLEMVIAGEIDDAYLKYAAKEGKHHNPFFQAGFDALREAMKENHVKYPLKQLTIGHVISDGDLVAVHSHLVLRKGEAGMVVVHLFRFQGDKIIEFWDVGQPVPENSLNTDGMF